MLIDDFTGIQIEGRRRGSESVDTVEPHGDLNLELVRMNSNEGETQTLFQGDPY